MTTSRRSTAALFVIGLVALLAYLRDPAWLIGVEAGFRPWETTGAARYRWTGGHASFFVRADLSGIEVPLRTTFSGPSEAPVTVTLTIDDRPAGYLTLTDESWRQVMLDLPAPGSRRVRRIDIRVNRTRAGNRGVAMGEIRPRR